MYLSTLLKYRTYRKLRVSARDLPARNRAVREDPNNEPKRKEKKKKEEEEKSPSPGTPSEPLWETIDPNNPHVLTDLQQPPHYLTPYRVLQEVLACYLAMFKAFDTCPRAHTA